MSPFLNARWIWHPPVDSMENFHLLVRRCFHLSSQPSHAACRITANSIYELWINGARIGRGPSPSFPEWQYFDTYDVARHLRPGDNIIAVRGYNFGPGTDGVLTQCPGRGGLLAEVEADGREIIITDESWNVLRDPARQVNTEPISGHRGGFKEVCDGRAEVLSWREADFDDSAWPSAAVLCGAEDGPWEHLIPREIPPPALEAVEPEEVYLHGAGKTYGGKPYDASDWEALRAGRDGCAIIQPLGEDFAPALLLDFGRPVYGYFRIEIEDSAGGTIELSYGESLHLTLVDRYTMRTGCQEYQPFERRGGRYLQLTFRGCLGPVRIRRVLCLRQSYPVEHKGEFLCSDERLNRIWQVGRYTVQMGMQDHFEDCPWREQTLYCGDLAVSAPLSYYAFGVQDLARKCLRQLARLQTDDGLIPPCGPAPSTLSILPEYPAFWVISLWEYHRHWDDEALLAELLPNVLACMKWYQDRLNADGLFARHDDDDNGLFVDNLSNIAAGEKLAAEQVILCHAFRCAAEMVALAGWAQQASGYNAVADNLAAAINRVFWSDSDNCLLDSLVPQQQSITQITNGLALVYDVAPPERQPALARVLLDRTKAPPMRAGYMNFFMVEALARTGLHGRAVERIREYWGAMLDRGATTFWETFDPDLPPGAIPQRLWSHCHPFCCGPVYSLPAHVAGIRTLSPGFERFEAAPRPGDLHWVRATVPTPRGPIRLTCLHNTKTHCQEVELTPPPTAEAEVLLQLPARDGGGVVLAGKAVQLEAPAKELRKIHRRLTAARREANGVRLCFASRATEETLRLSTVRQISAGSQPVFVAEPGGSWDAAPKPQAP